MALYIITWNLNKEKDKYQDAREKFLSKFNGLTWMQPNGLDSTRFVSTTMDVHELNDRLRAALDGNDRMFITKVDEFEYNGWIREKTWDWINSKV